MNFFHRKKVVNKERAKMKKKADNDHAEIMKKIQLLDKGTEQLENDITYRFFVAIGGKGEKK